MKYRDLIHFQPIESVIKMHEANEKQKAYELVSSYVISERMGRQIREHIVPHIQFDSIEDNKGLLIVGNYGTGKSHLMAVISTIAEDREALSVLGNQNSAKDLEAIAGKFHVIRMELGGVKIDLRDAVCLELEKGLRKIGINYHFPPINQITNNKQSFLEMMGLYHEHFPDQGLFIVIDELLDFLRVRNEQETVLDLGFLREIGELATSTRLRLMAGIQEKLFGNPHFQFVSQAIKHVQARFLQVHIVREDVAYVVSQRILAKNAEQKAWIREYLEPFMPLYQSLPTDIDRFVELFPVHPQFVTTFEQVLLGEKREILRTITDEIRNILDQDIDKKTLSLLSYDSYWDYLDANSSLSSDPSFERLKHRTNLALERVEKGLDQSQYWPLAQRIIHALAISRLTTDNDELPLGLTPQDLRDELCLYMSTPIQDMMFLTTTIISVCKDISRILGHQIILYNEDNDQYYLDMGTMVDYDGIVKEKTAVLSNDVLNRHYFAALARILNLTDEPYVPSAHIWRFDVPWLSHNVERPGYVFFGTPNQRSTAQPPREFYVYFLPPFKDVSYVDEGKDDEVFFVMDLDDGIEETLRFYAAARELARDLDHNSPHHREYTRRSDNSLKVLNEWMTQHFSTHVQVTYQRQRHRLVGIIQNLGFPPDSLIQEVVPKIAGHFLEPAFARQCPGYPAFPGFVTRVTQANIESYALDAIGRLAGKSTPSTSSMFLESLGLMSEGHIRPRLSPYAQWILSLMQEKATPHHLVNRSELMEVQFTRNGVEDVVYTTRYHLEPIMLLAVLTALVYSGDLVIVARNLKYDASRLMEWANLPLEDKRHFSHIERPKDMPLAALIALFELFSLPPVLIQQEKQRDEGIRRMQEKRQMLLEEVLQWEKALSEDLRFGGHPLWSSDEHQKWAGNFRALHDFLDDIGKYNTTGKLLSFPYSAESIRELADTLSQMRTEFVPVLTRFREVASLMHYLDKAGQILPSNDPWQDEAERLQDGVISELKGTDNLSAIKQPLQDLARSYKERYLSLHRQYRLSKAQDDRKNQLTQSQEWQALASLKLLAVVNTEQFDTLQKKLIGVKMCSRLTPSALEHDPICSHCHFKPGEETETAVDLDWFECQSQELLRQWTESLHDSLQDPYCRSSLDYFDSEAKPVIEDFVQTGEMPLPIPHGFVDGIKTVLEGIEAKEVTLSMIKEHLLLKSSALKPQDAKALLSAMIDEVVRGSADPAKVRVVFKLG